jgi:hypothetical protein
MQGIESLDKFKNFVSSIGGLGRYEDTYIVHAAEGETVVPMEVFDRNPVLKERLFESMRDMGIEPERYIVGNELNSINPITGQPEFFLKKIFKRIKKGVRDVGSRLRKAAADVSGYAAPIVGAMYGPLAGAGIGALLGQFKRENPGDPNQALQMALRGGISGIGTNLATGQGIMGTGLSNQFGFNPINIGKGVLGMGEMQAAVPDSIIPAGTDGIPVERFVAGTPARFVDRGGVNILEGLQRTFMKPGGKGISDLKIFDFLKSTGVDPNVKVSDAKAGGFLDNLLGKLGINKTALVFAGIYGTKALGDAIKEEYEKAEREREEKFGGPFGQRITDEQLLALLTTPELVSAPNTSLVQSPLMAAEGGGVLDLRQGGESEGPGTGTSDDIPAMLSDGEFVMTAKAVRGAGGGDRREGAKKMYEAMDQLEARA